MFSVEAKRTVAYPGQDNHWVHGQDIHYVAVSETVIGQSM